MWPDYPFYPRRRYDLANRAGIPIEDVECVTEEATRVVFHIPRCDLERLPCKRGVMALFVKGLPVIANTGLPVFVSDGRRTKPLMYDPAVQMTASEFASGHYYWFAFDKCDNTIMLMNAESTPAPV